MKTSASFLAGLIVGACAALLVSRVRQEQVDDEAALHAKLESQIRHLEERTEVLRKQEEPASAMKKA